MPSATPTPAEPLLPLPPQRCAVDRLREQHLLGEDQVRAVVVGHFVVVPHRDRVERAGDLAVALARRDAVFRVVLLGDDADAVRRTGRGAERAADALLEPGVLEAMELV